MLDTSKKRIVIICHSQGGIIASAWADMLLTDVPFELLSRVEIYTFAAAANHFSRPAASPDGRCQAFAHVEHFANEKDFVAQFGVMGYAPAPGEELGPNDDPNDPRFAPCTPITPVASAPWEHDDEGEHEGEGEGEGGGIKQHNYPHVLDPSKLTLKEKLDLARPVFEQWQPGDPLPNAIGDFGGRVFLRLNHAGHLFADHYIYPGDSILDDPFVRKHSQLVTYMDGKNVME